MNLRVFDRIERLVQTRHYSPETLARVHWTELCRDFRPRVAAAPNEATAYWLINLMLHELHDSHTVAFRPGQTTKSSGVTLAAARDTRITAAASASANSRVESRELADGVLYLRFDHFDSDSVRWLERELEAHRSAPGVILDLRENCGGFVLSARQAVGSFFDHRVPMGIVVHRNGRESIEQSVPNRSARYLGPLTVLVGSESCSSAEVFASVMQHYGRAHIVGQNTSGRVLGSEKFRLPDGGHLQLSTTGYETLEGVALEGRGVIPDVRVAIGPRGRALEDIDPDLTAALGIFHDSERSASPVKKTAALPARPDSSS